MPSIRVEDILYEEPSTYDDCNHPQHPLLAREESRKEQNHNVDRNGGDGQPKLRLVFLLTCHDHNELDRETEEEEKIEFQQGDVNLWLVNSGLLLAIDLIVPDKSDIFASCAGLR